jgi:hypothetical protein
MSDIFIVVATAFDPRGKRQHDRFDAHLRDTGELICSTTRQPLLDASRELLRRGVDSMATIRKVHASEPAVVRMRAPVGVAAQYDVMGEKFVRRKPAAGPMAGSRIGEAQSAAPEGPCDANLSRQASHSGPLWTASSPLAGIVNHNPGPAPDTACTMATLAYGVAR